MFQFLLHAHWSTYSFASIFKTLPDGFIVSGSHLISENAGILYAVPDTSQDCGERMLCVFFSLNPK